jgi:hypothetical protein
MYAATAAIVATAIANRASAGDRAGGQRGGAVLGTEQDHRQRTARR